MPRKRKVNYPPPRNQKKPPPPPGVTPPVRSSAVTIDLNATEGRTGLSVGDRVRIAGQGLYAGEVAVIERLVNGVVPAAFVRTDSGGTRQVRTIDLEPLRDEG